MDPIIQTNKECPPSKDLPSPTLERKLRSGLSIGIFDDDSVEVSAQPENMDIITMIGLAETLVLLVKNKAATLLPTYERKMLGSMEKLVSIFKTLLGGANAKDPKEVQ